MDRFRPLRLQDGFLEQIRNAPICINDAFICRICSAIYLRVHPLYCRPRKQCLHCCIEVTRVTFIHQWLVGRWPWQSAPNTRLRLTRCELDCKKRWERFSEKKSAWRKNHNAFGIQSYRDFRRRVGTIMESSPRRMWSYRGNFGSYRLRFKVVVEEVGN